jgi:hypothetical protein
MDTSLRELRQENLKLTAQLQNLTEDGQQLEPVSSNPASYRPIHTHDHMIT